MAPLNPKLVPILGTKSGSTGAKIGTHFGPQKALNLGTYNFRFWAHLLGRMGGFGFTTGRLGVGLWFRCGLNRKGGLVPV